MNAQDVQKKIAAALSRKKQLSVKECKLLLVDLVPTLGAVESRINAIKQSEHGLGRDGNATIGAGEVRLKALRTGTAEEVAALDEELRELRIVRSQLVVQKEAINKRMEVAADEEAATNLPELHRVLNARIDDAMVEAQKFRESLTAASQALIDVEQANKRLGQAYGLRGASYERVPGTEEQVERINALVHAADGGLLPPNFQPRSLFFLRQTLGMVDKSYPYGHVEARLDTTSSERRERAA